MNQVKIFWIVFLYGLLIGIFGWIGYIKGHSLPSLIIGSSAAALLLICAFSLRLSLVWGYRASLLITTLLLLFFTHRAMISNRMPPIFLGLLSAAVLIGLILQSSQRKS